MYCVLISSTRRSHQRYSAQTPDTNLVVQTKFSGTYEDRGIFIFLAQLTTSRIGNLTRFIYTVLYV